MKRIHHCSNALAQGESIDVAKQLTFCGAQGRKGPELRLPGDQISTPHSHYALVASSSSWSERGVRQRVQPAQRLLIQLLRAQTVLQGQVRGLLLPNKQQQN